jgi:hypothetical protein
LRSERLARQLGHPLELTPVPADVRHFVRDDEVTLSVDGRLHVIADDAGALALARANTVRF